MANETLDILIEFFEQEQGYTKEVYNRPDKTESDRMLLKRRIDWFTTLIGTLKEAKTEKGVQMLKEAIEREKLRLKQKEMVT